MRRQSAAPCYNRPVVERDDATMRIGKGSMAQQPLSGIRVLDLTRVMTGPYCTMMLGDMGADIIKVEIPGKGDDTRPWGPPFLGGVDAYDASGESAYYLSINRNKRSITVNMKDERGRQIVERIAATADVVVENFAPGVAARLGIGYEAVKALKPDVVYCSISGFGQDGPGFDRTAYDIIVQGMSGMMSITGEAGGMPTKMGVPIADMTAGMFAAYAIVNALLHRQRTGEGQYIDNSMLGGQVALLAYYAVGYFATGQAATRQGNRHQTVVPYDTFPTADGYVNLAIGNDRLWARFCEAFGLSEAAADPRFASNASRMANLEPLYAAMNGALSQFTTAEVMVKMDALGVPGRADQHGRSGLRDAADAAPGSETAGAAPDRARSPHPRLPVPPGRYALRSPLSAAAARSTLRRGAGRTGLHRRGDRRVARERGDLSEGTVRRFAGWKVQTF